MPMVPEAAVAMLACTRIGAIHSVVFGGFSPDALAGRIQDCQSNCVITADEGVRGGRAIPLKANTDKALQSCPDCTTCFVIRRTGASVSWEEGRDIWYHDALAAASAGLPARRNECRRSDVHPVYLRLDWQAPGCIPPAAIWSMPL